MKANRCWLLFNEWKEAFGPTGLQVYQNVIVRTVSSMVGDFSVSEVNHNSLVFVRYEVPFRWRGRGGHLRKIRTLIWKSGYWLSSLFSFPSEAERIPQISLLLSLDGYNIPRDAFSQSGSSHVAALQWGGGRVKGKRGDWLLTAWLIPNDHSVLLLVFQGVFIKKMIMFFMTKVIFVWILQSSICAIPSPLETTLAEKSYCVKNHKAAKEKRSLIFNNRQAVAFKDMLSSFQNVGPTTRRTNNALPWKYGGMKGAGSRSYRANLYSNNTITSQFG